MRWWWLWVGVFGGSWVHLSRLRRIYRNLSEYSVPRRVVLHRGVHRDSEAEERSGAESGMNTGRRSQKVGKQGEDLAALKLRSMGYLRIFKLNEARTAKGIRVRRVPGDYSAIEAGTLRSVLVEVKATESDRIEFGRLQDHQVRELNEHTEIGAPGLLVLVFKDSVHVLSWPIEGFERGTSIVNKNGNIYLRGKK